MGEGKQANRVVRRIDDVERRTHALPIRSRSANRPAVAHRTIAGRFHDARDALRQGFEELRINRDMAFQTHLLLIRAEVLTREPTMDREAVKSDLASGRTRQSSL